MVRPVWKMAMGVVGLLSLGCSGTGGGKMAGTYCHKKGDCLTLTHIEGNDYSAALTDRSGKGGLSVKPKKCGPAGCDYMFGPGKLLTAYDPGADELLVTRMWGNTGPGPWHRQ